MRLANVSIWNAIIAAHFRKMAMGNALTMSKHKTICLLTKYVEFALAVIDNKTDMPFEKIPFVRTDNSPRSPQWTSMPPRTLF